MEKEIEKKYLVIKEKLPKLKGGELYIQGYLSILPHIRFRAIRNNDGRFEVLLTIKEIEDGGISRKEWNFEPTRKWSKKEVLELGRIAGSKMIEKERYKIKKDGLIWEVDVYRGRNDGLVTVDVEIPFEGFNINNFPNWVNKDKEITNDPKFFNRNLGEKPYKADLN